MNTLGKNMWKKYKQILVTGCQRSGTKIASEIIAYETGYKFFWENGFGVDSLELYESLYGHKLWIDENNRNYKTA